MVTRDSSQGTHGAPETADDRLREENVRLVRRISLLRGALDAAGRDNDDLRRRLAGAQHENHELRQLTPARGGERRAQWRDAMTEPWARNP